MGFQIQGAGSSLFYLRLCGNCNGPTFFTPEGDYSPGSLPGNPVEHVPDELAPLKHEARASAAAGAYTAAVLTCRKMLMHIAAQQGAKPNQSFIDYVTYLADKGYVPPNGKVWVDYIRQRSNEANHEILLMTREDAIALINFVEMLLRFIYELPNLAPTPPAAPATPATSP